MSIDDVLTRALEAEADEVSVPDDAWERLVERLAREPAAAESPPTPPRQWVLLAAALVLVVAAVAAAVTLSGDERPLRTGPEEGDPGPTASTVTSPSTPTTTVEAVRPAPEPPGKVVVVTGGGDLLRFDVATGDFVALATSNEPVDEETGTVYDHIDAATVGADGTVLFSTCCEPVSGLTFQLDPDGTRAQAAFGYSPSFGPDGTVYALVDPVSIRIVDGGDAGEHQIHGGSRAGELAAVAWSPQGDRLAVTSARPTGGDDGARSEVLVLPVEAESLDEAELLAPPVGRWWSDPVFRDDGSLLVIEHDDTAGTTAVRAVRRDGRAGEALDIQGMQPGLLAADRSGGWVLIAAADGGPGRILGPDDNVSLGPDLGPDPLVDLAW